MVRLLVKTFSPKKSPNSGENNIQKDSIENGAVHRKKKSSKKWIPLEANTKSHSSKTVTDSSKDLAFVRRTSIFIII